MKWVGPHHKSTTHRFRRQVTKLVADVGPISGRLITLKKLFWTYPYRGVIWGGLGAPKEKEKRKKKKRKKEKKKKRKKRKKRTMNNNNILENIQRRHGELSRSPPRGIRKKISLFVLMSNKHMWSVVFSNFFNSAVALKNKKNLVPKKKLKWRSCIPTFQNGM